MQRSRRLHLAVFLLVVFGMLFSLFPSVSFPADVAHAQQLPGPLLQQILSASRPTIDFESLFDLSRLPTEIIVTGYGRADTVPDVARITMHITGSGQDEAAAAAVIDDKLLAVLSALDELEIPGDAVRFDEAVRFGDAVPGDTTTLPRPENVLHRSRTTAGIELTEEVELRLYEISRVPDLMTALAETHTERIWDIDYRLHDENQLRAKAFAAAIRDARERADALATALGRSVVAIINVTDESGPGIIRRTPIDGPFTPLRSSEGPQQKFSAETFVTVKFLALPAD